MSAESTPTVLQTDRAWPDDSIERQVIEAAGLALVSGPPHASPTETVERMVAERQPAAIMTCWAPVSAAAIAASPALRLVARMGVGLDNIAVDAATERGVLVTNVPDYCVEEVSDHAVGLVLAWTRGLVRTDREVRAGRWDPGAARLRRLATLTCGVIGYGRIGRVSARKLADLGARVIASDPFAPADTRGVPVVPLDELLRSSDAVIVHAPLTPATRHLIGSRELSLMPAEALLVNVSRGALVDTAALIEALRDGRLGGAGLDVLESEPAVPRELLEHPGVVITPHIGFSSDVAVEQLRRSTAEEVVRVLSGQPPLHLCNQPAATAAKGARP
ncbi:MAG TPA: C-terminal binding protein [Solirubrobacteraceae bacterium]|nr:C-terminal binding protein [Solirubrobacteraceae bacterium]